MKSKTMTDRFRIDKPGTKYQVSEWFPVSGERKSVASFLTEAKAYVQERTQDSER